MKGWPLVLGNDSNTVFCLPTCELCRPINIQVLKVKHILPFFGFPVTVMLPCEIVDDKMKFNETTSGNELKKILEQHIAFQEDAVRLIDEQVLEENDPVIVAQIKHRMGEVQGKVRHAKSQLQITKKPCRAQDHKYFSRAARLAALTSGQHIYAALCSIIDSCAVRSIPQVLTF